MSSALTVGLAEFLERITAAHVAEARELQSIAQEFAQVLRQLPERENVRSPVDGSFLKPGQFAERIGVSRSKVYDLIKSGLPTIAAGPRSRLVDVAAADHWLRSSSQGARQPPTQDGSSTPVESRAAIAAERAALRWSSRQATVAPK